ncbi:MAG: transposase [Janthinobacterium lividum]
MRFEADILYHVYNRGNDGLQLFYEPGDYGLFLRKMRALLTPHCHLLAYCLMPNHFHLLLQPTPAGAVTDNSSSTTRQPLTRGLATLLSSYTQALNPRLQRQGALFQPKTKSKPLNGPFQAAYYPLTYFHYIHQNPSRAGLTNQLDGWPYSSYRDYAGLRSGTLCDQTLAAELLALPTDTTQFVAEAAAIIDWERVRGAWV